MYIIVKSTLKLHVEIRYTNGHVFNIVHIMSGAQLQSVNLFLLRFIMKISLISKIIRRHTCHSVCSVAWLTFV